VDYKDYYKILEIDKKATPAEVKKAYRTLAKKNHPDKNLGDKKAEERFKLVNEANEVLGNPEKRKQYDDLGENWQQNQQNQNQQRNPNQQSRQGNQGFGGGNQEDFSDFFEQFFTQQRGGNSQQNQARKAEIMKPKWKFRSKKHSQEQAELFNSKTKNFGLQQNLEPIQTNYYASKTKVQKEVLKPIGAIYLLEFELLIIQNSFVKAMICIILQTSVYMMPFWEMR
jgi:DnaJ-class molecular chaperone